MAGRGKGKNKLKLKKTEIIFNDRRIDLRRFAYDIIVHSITRFHVPRNCICIWEDKENDYGCPDFSLIVSRIIIRQQLVYRHVWNEEFEHGYKTRDFQSFHDVKRVMQDVMQDTVREVWGAADEVQLLVSAISELIIFLYSKSCNLYLKDLVRYWYGYMCPIKQKFEKAGGIDFFYQMGNTPRGEREDAFNDKFISKYCLPYAKFASDKNICSHYYYLSVIFTQDHENGVPSEEEWTDVPPERDIPEWIITDFVHPSLPRLDQASGTDPSVNTGLGIRRHEDVLRDIGVSLPDNSTPSPNPPGPSVEPRRHRRGPTSQMRRQRYRSSSNVEQGVGQSSVDSSATTQPRKKQLSVPVADVPTPAQTIPGGSGEPAKPLEGLFGQQKSQSSSSVDSSATTQPMKKKVGAPVADIPKPAQSTPGGSLEPAKLRQGLSGQQESQSSSRVDSSATTQPRKKQLSVPVADVPTPAQSIPGGSLEPAKLRQGLSGQQESQSSSSVDSSATKQPMKKKVGVPVADIPTPAQSIPGGSGEPAKTHEGSGQQETRSSLCSSVEQDLGQLSLGTSASKQPRKRKQNEK